MTGQQQTQQGQADRLAAALALLEQGVTTLLTDDAFAAYLRTLARFHQYSARNVLLIHCQRPDATRVAGYRAWQALGRQVRRGEHGIRILAPHRRLLPLAETDPADTERLEIITGFGVVTVFDIAQTDGAPLPTPPVPQLLAGDTPVAIWLWNRLAIFLAAEGVNLTRAALPQGLGCYLPLRRQVVVAASLTDVQAAKTLAHECAHHVALTVRLDHLAGPRADAETIAEGAAFVLLAHYGLDTSAYTFPYVAGWAADRAVLARNLAAIRTTAARLIDAVVPPVAANAAPAPLARAA
jgi:antirestriction protein ArdC